MIYFVANVLDYELFYLTPDGEDVSNCGKTEEMACKTLDQILGIYYSGSSSAPQNGLEIITSKPLITVDKKLMVGKINQYISKISAED